MSFDVLHADDSTQSPEASVSDMDWFVGLWVGEVFGGVVEHRVMKAHKGHMPGLVRLRSGDTDDVFLYELSSFIEVGNTITYRIRHFGADLVANQERAEFIDRPLIRMEDGNAYFDGITFARTGPDTAVVTFVLADDDGELSRHTVRYERRG